MSNRTFYSAVVSFLLGVFIFSFEGPGRFLTEISLIFRLTSLGSAVGAALICCWQKKTRRRCVLVFFCTILFLLGAFRITASTAGRHPLDESIGKKVNLTGFICDEPAQREKSQGICFRSDLYTDKVLLSAAVKPRRFYGERLFISGKLELPENFQAYEGGPEFDYVSYLAKDDIRYVMRRPKAYKIGDGAGSRLTAILIGIKSAFMDRIRSVLAEPRASLVGGLLLGEKGMLPQDVSDDFKRSGLTHILVLSGSNVTVIAQTLLSAFSFLPKTIGPMSGGTSIVLFAIMTGASATTVRATIMALIGLFAQLIGRRYDVMRALALSAVLMLIQNPRILAFDISFQLSFLATLAVIFVSPLVKQRLGFIPERFGMREILSMTIATQLFTFPFIFFKMGEISVIALLPNLLVLPIVPYAMLGGFVSGIAAFAHDAAARPFALATDILLVYMLKVTAFFARFPFATIKATLGPPFLVVSYIVFVWVIVRLRKRDSLQRSAN